ncbi:MAG: prolipoprotein diacylglyceryl transferase, partial [Armatimonadetes bacterium CG17_big_fil_post_rev_8_21_14_2_50_66_6]
MKLGWFRVNAYGFLLLIGFAAGTAWAAREARRRDLSPDLIIDYALWALLSAIIGSRIVFVLLDLRSYLQQPETMWQIWKGGLSFHGGLAAALL